MVTAAVTAVMAVIAVVVMAILMAFVTEVIVLPTGAVVTRLPVVGAPVRVSEP